MDLSTMRTEAREIFGQTDESNSDITNTQLTRWANVFYRYVCMELEAIPIKERAYTTATTVSLDDDTSNVNLAKFKIQPENEWRELEVRDLDDLISRDADYENADTGKPEWLVRTGTFTARLYPPLDSSNDAQASGLKTYGLELPTELSSDSDVPDLPKGLHDVFPNYMAHRAFLRLKDTEAAAQQLVLANDGIRRQKSLALNFSKKKGWQWHDSDPGSDCSY